MNKLKNISASRQGGNFVLSNLQKFERKTHSEAPSIKMVLSGNEHYKVNGRRYTLDLEHFLLVDNNEWVETYIDADKNVKGICIYPEKELLNEVVKTRLSSCQSILDSPFEYNEIRLIHNKFNLGENRTGKFLMQHIGTILQLQENKKDIDFENFYIQLAECLIDDQLELEGKLKNVSTAKRATKEELYRRVVVARNYITDNYTQKVSLEELAEEALLSKYHFIRTFKNLFNVSPYQYLLQVRLQKARELIARDYSYNEASILTGFSDGKNLRKALKKFSTK